MSRPLGVALLGCGVVGTQVARLLVEQQTELAARVGAPLQLRGVAVRRAGRTRGVDVDPALFTTDAAELVRRDDVDLVVEVIGGIEPARSLILDALEHGASVVTANKALLAEDGATLVRPPPRRPGGTCSSRHRSPGRSRSCDRWPSRWPATGSTG